MSTRRVLPGCTLIELLCVLGILAIGGIVGAIVAGYIGWLPRGVGCFVGAIVLYSSILAYMFWAESRERRRSSADRAPDEDT